MFTRILAVSEAETLDEFVRAHKVGAIEQSWEWGALQCKIPGRTGFFVVGVFEGSAKAPCEEGRAHAEGALVGSALFVRQEMWRNGKTWLWCPRGPLLPEGHEKDAWQLILDACAKETHEAGDVFLRVEPGIVVGGEAGDGWCDLGGKTPHEEYLPSTTLLLDLGLGLEELRAQMTQKGRYNIKVAEKAGVTVHAESGEKSVKNSDFGRFYEILVETAKRDGFQVHSRKFYEDFLTILGEKAVLYTAHLGGEVLGGILVTHFGVGASSRATYYFGASSNVHREAMAPYLLQWHAICAAKKAGIEVYDFLGIAPEGADGHALSGVTQFKTRFGGGRVRFCGPRVFIFRRVWWLFYRLAKAIF
ncbi:MAG: peptidoglycan bridge formation glycyltransferase FemA/FemB family protein [Candidatus Gracilibacteria bacterium]|jgi:lipid II:glycine glycyltransferase (peptidoglycan interpeptide bridge formation enzyme)